MELWDVGLWGWSTEALDERLRMLAVVQGLLTGCNLGKEGWIPRLFFGGSAFFSMHSCPTDNQQVSLNPKTLWLLGCT